jgi:4-amino-4-deoxy-L-arabinose transferase-like glycosyltransferase
MAVIWFRPGPTLLLGGDSGIYARIARELAERPVSSWWRVTLDGLPFHEHPPLGFWLEAVVFRLLGPTVSSAVTLARLSSSVALVLVGITAWELAARRTRMVDGIEGASLGAFAMLGTICLPGFLYTSQVAMLEATMLTPIALGAWAAASLMASRAPGGDRFPRGAVVTFATAFTLAFWVKGPPALVLVGVVLALAVLGRVRWSVAVIAIAWALVLTVVTTAAFDAVCRAHGAEPYFTFYFRHQVFPSMTEGRHNPNHDPWFYLPVIANWYGPALASLAVIAGVGLVRQKRPWAWRLSPELSIVGALLWFGVIVGFSLMTQKYQWYVHIGAIGAGLVVGASLSLVPSRWEPSLTLALLVLTVCWPVVRWLPWALTPAQEQLAAVQSTPPFDGADRRVADCSKMESWAAEHLLSFQWKARRVACDEAAGHMWDGHKLIPRP